MLITTKNTTTKFVMDTIRRQIQERIRFVRTSINVSSARSFKPTAIFYPKRSLQISLRYLQTVIFRE